MQAALLAALILSATSGPDASLTRFLKAINARLDHSVEGQTHERPRKGYHTSKAWSNVQREIEKTLAPAGWTLNPGHDNSYSICTKADQEISFVTWEKSGVRFYIERCPDWVRTLRDGRSKFLDDLQAVDEDFTPFAGEGWANEVLFPAGSADKLFYVSGDYFTTSPRRGDLYLASFARVDGRPTKLWEVMLLSGVGEPKSGSLTLYLASQKWHVKDPTPEVIAELTKQLPLSYSSENSGDGGKSIGFIDVKGHLDATAHAYPINLVVSLEEERYLKSLKGK
jgi:hypothetical protein